MLPFEVVAMTLLIFIDMPIYVAVKPVWAF